MWLLTVVHRSLFSAKQRSAGKQYSSSSAQQQQQQQQDVVRQRLEHAELCGFKPIDSPASALASRRQTSGKGGHKTSSESSSNPFSGDEFY